jgi:signal transduction histidine kinase
MSKNYKRQNLMEYQVNQNIKLLRMKAETISEDNPNKNLSMDTNYNILKLNHELEIYQIELQMQNNELLLAKEAAQEIAQKYADLYNFAPTGYLTFSQNGRIVELNLCAAQMLGKNRSQLIHSQFGFFISDTSKLTFNSFLEKIFTTKSKTSCEVILENSCINGFPIYLQLTGIINKNNKQCEISASDISSYKQAKFKLEENQNILQSTFESPREVNIVSLDKNYCYLTFNNFHFVSMQKKYGIDVEIGTNMLGYIKDEEERLKTKHFFDMALAGENHSTEEQYSILDNDGWITKFSPIYNKKHEIYGATAYALNISQIKQIEKELIIAKNRAEESDRLKTAFLQNISHEIRTPMNMIMGFSNLMADDFDDKANLQEHVQIVNESCNDLLNMINEILDIAKIESGQLTINETEFNINSVFNELEHYFRHIQDMQGKQKVSFQIAVQLPNNIQVIYTDKVKLKQVLINLIKNAFKFTEKGIIEAGCKFDKQNNLLFYVKDDGIGIPEDKQKVIFERFVQVNKKSTNRGTGLGLSIVQGLVDLLKGEIFLNSKPGKGSTFSFTIPYKKGN